METKLSVLVQVDLDGADVRLVVTGCVTEVNQRALQPVIGRARTVLPAAVVSVDLTAAQSVESAAVELLRTGIDHQHPSGTVELLTPVAGSPQPLTPGPGRPLVTAPDRGSRHERFHRSRALGRSRVPAGTRAGR